MIFLNDIDYIWISKITDKLKINFTSKLHTRRFTIKYAKISNVCLFLS